MKEWRRTWVLFVGYLLLLVWGIVFKLDVFQTVQNFYYREWAGLNLIPLKGSDSWVEIVLNIFAFVPLGIFLEMLRKEANWPSQLLLAGVVSLFFEVVQYSFRIGMADITDFLGNTFGAAIGIILMYLLTSVWQEETEKRLHFLLLIGLISTFLYAIVTGF